MSPEALQDIRDSLLSYPDLRLTEETPVRVVGSLPLRDDDGSVLDRFLISLEFPEEYPHALPIVRETGGRIPQTADRHNSAGIACVIVPIDWQVRRPDLSLSTFLSGPVTNYFLGQALVEAGLEWPHGERSHGVFGTLEALCDLSGAPYSRARELLELLSKERIKGHYDCPCGSGARLRNCHGEKIFKLSKVADSKWTKALVEDLSKILRANRDGECSP